VTINFEGTSVDNAMGTWRGIVISPDHQILSSAPIQIGPMGNKTETVSFTAPVSGSYKVIFMVDEQSGMGSTLGSASISSKDGAVQHFAPTSALHGAGEQVGFEFELSK
jgi:hypothetical protein